MTCIFYGLFAHTELDASAETGSLDVENVIMFDFN